ncbi:hypothetical protein [Methylorubrum zatmanii]
MLVLRPPSPVSALSAPQNFIAEDAPRRASRRRRRIVSLTLIIAMIGVGSLLAMTGDYGQASRRDGAAVAAHQPDRQMSLSDRIERERDLVAQWRRLDLPSSAHAASPATSQDSAQATSPSSGAAPAEALSRAEPSPGANLPQPADRTETTASIADTPAASLRDGGRLSTEAAPHHGNTIDRADLYLRRGQYTIARYLYEEAYRDGEILGAVGMAKSYDTAYLKSLGLKSKGDPQKSRIWYRRASELSVKRRQEAP